MNNSFHTIHRQIVQMQQDEAMMKARNHAHVTFMVRETIRNARHADISREELIQIVRREYE